MEIRTRMAPSPTGFFHVGSLRTALYNFLFARKNNGKFVLRIEDTDKARMVSGALENIVQTLADFNISADEGSYWDNGVKVRGNFGPYYQSQRLDLYHKYAEELVAKKAAYYCFCSPQRLAEIRKEHEAKKVPPKYDKHCLKLSETDIRQKLRNNELHVVRLNVPADKRIRFTDLVHGEIEVSSNDLDDQVLLKSDGYPTYHLAVVVDDHLMKITHVIRGDEWIPSTPKHILLYSAFGWESPQFVHLPLLLSKSRKKLSKREGAVAVKDFLEKGYLPEAVLNFVALLGWNPKTEQEIFNLRELIDQFSLEKLNKSAAVFDLEKLDWLNGMYIRKISLDELTTRCLPFLKQAGIDFENYPREFIQKVIALEQERLKMLSEIGERVTYFFKDPEYDARLLIYPPPRNSAAVAKATLAKEAAMAGQTPKETIMKNLQSLCNFLQTLDIKDFTEARIKDWIKKLELKTGEVLWPLRVALTGLEASPGPFEIMDAFSVLPNGKEIILGRVSKAIELLFG